MKTIVVADPIDIEAIDLLKTQGFEVMDLSKEKNKLIQFLPTASGLIVRSATKATKELLDKAPELQIIGRAGVGLDNIDLDECKNRGIVVVNSPEGPTRSVAELALTMMITVARNLGEVYSGTKAGEWPKNIKGKELHGKTLGIIGSGAIGGTFARYAIAIGMSVLAYDIIKYSDLEELDQFRYVSLEELYTNSDVISMHVPLLPATNHMINQEAISKMKKGVIIPNTSRGGVIDENALLDGLNSGIVYGAGLDTFENEPVKKDQPLIQHPKVFATAHIGAQTKEANKKNSIIISEKIINHFK